MSDIKVQDLYKIIVGLVAFIVGSWTLFGWGVKRWIMATDDKIKELYGSRNNADIAIAEREVLCEERHKKK